MLPPRRKPASRQGTISHLKKQKAGKEARKFDDSFVDESAEISLIIP